MKKNYILSTLFLIICGCSSLEMEPLSSSKDEVQRILALGLTHDENLIEASKLSSSHMIAVVTTQLKKVYSDKRLAVANLEESAIFADNVKFSNNNSKFVSKKMQFTETAVLLVNPDQITYFIEGTKNPASNSFKHSLKTSIKYTSSERREYTSVNFCDKWQGCDASDKIDLKLLSSAASNCNSDVCDYTEKMETVLSSTLLDKYSQEGFKLRFNSKKETTKLQVTSAYLMGYLSVAK
ncbi:hypothetical protein N8773_00840 [Candidatus Pseudothioglobus singularis]|jgi:hypothetical protein|nr:hypothetical protein [Candidatus Pseudothioglobus singularis]